MDRILRLICGLRDGSGKVVIVLNSEEKLIGSLECLLCAMLSTCGKKYKIDDWFLPLGKLSPLKEIRLSLYKTVTVLCKLIVR